MKMLSRFLKSTSGNVSVFFALSAIPVFLAVGGAIDFVRHYNKQTSVIVALDSAALAAAQSTAATPAQREAVAKQFFAANFDARDIEGETDPVVTVTASHVKVKADLKMKTAILGMFGIDTLAVNAESEAKNTTPGSAEVVLVLDYSGSMNQQQKYQRMATAATDMLDAFENVDGDVDFEVGLVPFSAMVRTSMSSAYVTQSSGSSTWTGCTQDRRYPHNNGVATPSSNANTKWGYIDNGNGGENSGQYNCQGYANKNLTVLNLTEDLDEVRQQLDLMRPLGNTNIALGAEFGWNLLDPALPYASGRAYADQTNKKFLVLLTDGVQTSRGWGQGNTRTVGNAQTNLLGLCTGMRNAGITVFTIAYDVDDSAVTDMLEACAPGRYFEPGIGGNDLGEVFSEITTLITNDVVRLTR